MKNLRIIIIFSLLVMAITSCLNLSTIGEDVNDLIGDNASTEALTDTSMTPARSENTVVVVEKIEDLDWPNFDADDLNSDVGSADMTVITLNGTSATVKGEGAQVNGRIITITSAGTYQVSGLLEEGQIIVDTGDEDLVHLIFNGIDISTSSNAPILVQNANKTVITLAAGTENLVTDERNELSDDSNEANAALFSNDDLIINGTGSLMVTGNAAHGIASDDDLKIVSGAIAVNALRNGIQGRDSIVVKDSSLVIEAGSDGLQSDNDEDADEGNIFIEGGSFEITSGHDGIQSVNILAIRNGEFNITTGGGSGNVDRGITNQWGDWDRQESAGDSDISEKGLKTGVQLIIFSGDFQIDSADDTIHSNNVIQIHGGVFELASGDDGLQADSLLEINDGTLVLVQSFEGIESAQIIINGGSLSIVADDDGINGSAGNSEGMMGGRPGGGNFEGGTSTLSINGGDVIVSAGGDGIDINGSIEMTNGMVLVNGPTESMNGAIDYLGSFKITGGIFVAVGSIGMAEAPSANSTQAVLMVNFNSARQAGTLFHIESALGENIITFMPAKTYQSVVVSAPNLSMDETYLVYSGGSAEGHMNDGLYSNETYTPGTQVDSFKFTRTVVTLGTTAGGAMGGQNGMMGDP